VSSHDFDELAVPLSEHDLTDDPFELFRKWYEDAVDTRPGDWFLANAMSLATSDDQGVPHARIVLLKGITQRGVVFFSNYESQKGREIAANPRVATTMHWPHRYRQVRLEGTVSRTSHEVSESYFHSRPRGSQLSATISRQSAPVAGREVLEERYRDVEAELVGEPVPLPDYWGGYEITVDMIEFWQSRRDRLHDRFRYRFADNKWEVNRLEP
jgi:pyridoxamine 5'-phosphate oxidase